MEDVGGQGEMKKLVLTELKCDKLISDEYSFPFKIHQKRGYKS